MASSTATITVYPYPKGKDNTQRNVVLYGTIAISTGGTYPAGGFALSWANVEEAKTIPPGSTTPSSTTAIIPSRMTITSAANPPSGYVYVWNSVNGNLHIFESNNGVSANSGPLVEVGGAIANAIVVDVIQFEAIFPRE